MQDNCDSVLSPTGPITGGSYDGCEGTISYTYTYTDCEGTSHDWVYTYTIEREDFTVPENRDTTVACRAMAVTPTAFLPIVQDNCDSVLSPTGPITGGSYDGCEGTISYTYTYTDCEGTSHDWVYTYTIEREDFTVPENRDTTVACRAMAVTPTAFLPIVQDNCDSVLSPTGPITGGSYDGCEGTISYTYTYTDCEGTSHDWVYTYTIEREDFTVPENRDTTVACRAMAVTPTAFLPIVQDNCDSVLSPTGPITGGSYDGCEGTISYTYTYTDCEGTSHDWVYTYTIEREDFTVPENRDTTVACRAMAVTPTAFLPIVQDNCDSVLSPTGPITGGSYDGCEGTISYTYTYTDCEGTSP